MKRLFVAVTVILAMTLCAASAMAWGSATHAYIEERLNLKGPWLKLNQVYGGMATDIFTFVPGTEAFGWSNAVHCEGSSAMWGAASSLTTKAQAYGFISHNQLWGADFYAHNYGCNFQLPTTGYVYWRAERLMKLLPSDLQTYLNGLPGGLGIELVRNVVEYAVDILLISKDPAIGAKVSTAALLRGTEFPSLLSATFNGVDPTVIIEAEQQFRQAMISYGQMLSLGQLVAIIQISEQAASLVQQLYPFIDKNMVNSASIRSAIFKSMLLCAPDYLGAINATISGVRAQMIYRGFIY